MGKQRHPKARFTQGSRTWDMIADAQRVPTMYRDAQLRRYHRNKRKPLDDQPGLRAV